MREIKKSSWINILTTSIIFLFLFITANHLELSLGHFVDGISNVISFLGRMFPPDLSVLPSLFEATVITLETDLWGTFLGIILGALFSLGAARNLLGQNPIIYWSCRTILTVLRSLPDLVWALIFVSAVGLGPFPGVLALMVFSIGELGKLFAEAIENINPSSREALESTGANMLKVIRYAIIPQIMPEITTFCLFRRESNVRRAFVLGMVGAGGLGFELNVAMRLFQYKEASAIIVLIIVTVAIIYAISSKIRNKII